MASAIISHKGIVSHLSDDGLIVEVPAQTACQGCHAAQVCSSGTGVRQIRIEKFTGRFRIGQRVSLTIHRDLGRKAVLLAYVFPLFILFPVLIAGQKWLGSEEASALVALLSVALYYGALYLFRFRIAKTIRIDIQESDDNE